MNLSYPGALYFLLLVPLVVLLYLLRLRHRETRVTSLLLWKRLVNTPKANSVFRKLKDNLLMFLQILILLLLILTLGKPFLTIEGLYPGERVILIIDSSASMKSIDVSPNRFALAQRKALALIEALKPGGRMSIIESSFQPKVLAHLESDKGKLAKIVRGLEAKDVHTDIRDSLNVALSLAREGEKVRIHVLTDGAFEGGDLSTEGKVEWHYFGRSSDNVGIIKFSARKVPRSHYDYELFLTLRNYSEGTREFTVRTYYQDLLIDKRSLTLEPKEVKSFILPFPFLKGGILKAEIDLKDDLKVDNEVYLTIPPPEKVPVLLVSRGNYFLEKALQLLPHLSLKVVKPEDYEAKGGYGLTIFDSFSPPILKGGNYLFINSLPPGYSTFKAGGEPWPMVTSWDRASPLLKYVDLSNMEIEEAPFVVLPPGSQVIARSRSTPLIFLQEKDNLRLVCLNFDLYRSDLPLRVAFPLLFSNLINWFLPSNSWEVVSPIKGGSIFSLPLGYEVREIMVTDPKGRRKTIQVDRGYFNFAETEEQGLYRVSWADKEILFSVGLLEERESNILPRVSKLKVREVKEEGGSLFKRKLELWRFILIIALILLIFEGYISQIRSKILKV